MLKNIGTAHGFAGRYDEAMRFFELADAEVAASPMYQVMSLNVANFLCEFAKRPDLAAPWARKRLKLSSRTN
jgi:hypothetical protein